MSEHKPSEPVKASNHPQRKADAKRKSSADMQEIAALFREAMDENFIQYNPCSKAAFDYLKKPGMTLQVLLDTWQKQGFLSSSENLKVLIENCNILRTEKTYNNSDLKHQEKEILKKISFCLDMEELVQRMDEANGSNDKWKKLVETLAGKKNSLNSGWFTFSENDANVFKSCMKYKENTHFATLLKNELQEFMRFKAPKRQPDEKRREKKEGKDAKKESELKRVKDLKPPPAREYKQICMWGDAHGNAQNMLTFGILSGALSLDKKEVEKEIEKFKKLTPHEIENFADKYEKIIFSPLWKQILPGQREDMYHNSFKEVPHIHEHKYTELVNGHLMNARPAYRIKQMQALQNQLLKAAPNKAQLKLFAYIYFLNIKEEFDEKFYNLNSARIADGKVDEYIDTFKKRFSAASQDKLLEFFGDLLADRGPNDIWVLATFKALLEMGIPYEIIASNHDMEFLLRYEAHIKGNPAIKRLLIPYEFEPGVPDQKDMASGTIYFFQIGDKIALRFLTEAKELASVTVKCSELGLDSSVSINAKLLEEKILKIAELLKAKESPLEERTTFNYANTQGQTQSFEGLMNAIQFGNLTKKYLQKLVEECYIPHLKLIDLDKHGNFKAHAPVDPDQAIQKAISYFHLDPNGATPQEVVAAVNHEFKAVMKDSEKRTSFLLEYCQQLRDATKYVKIPTNPAVGTCNVRTNDYHKFYDIEGYELHLMSHLPKDGIPLPGVIYLEKAASGEPFVVKLSKGKTEKGLLRYVVKLPSGENAEGAFDILTEEDLSSLIISKQFKQEILVAIADRSEIHPTPKSLSKNNGLAKLIHGHDHPGWEELEKKGQAINLDSAHGEFHASNLDNHDRTPLPMAVIDNGPAKQLKTNFADFFDLIMPTDGAGLEAKAAAPRGLPGPAPLIAVSGPPGGPAVGPAVGPGATIVFRPLTDATSKAPDVAPLLHPALADPEQLVSPPGEASLGRAAARSPVTLPKEVVEEVDLFSGSEIKEPSGEQQVNNISQTLGRSVANETISQIIIPHSIPKVSSKTSIHSFWGKSKQVIQNHPHASATIAGTVLLAGFTHLGLFISDETASTHFLNKTVIPSSVFEADVQIALWLAAAALITLTVLTAYGKSRCENAENQASEPQHNHS